MTGRFATGWTFWDEGRGWPGGRGLKARTRDSEPAAWYKPRYDPWKHPLGTEDGGPLPRGVIVKRIIGYPVFHRYMGGKGSRYRAICIDA